MLKRAYLVAVVTAFAVTPCHADKSAGRDGSTMEKAIPLKQRGLKAVDEQMQWMMKLHGSTPMLATRDVLQKSADDAARRLKAGQKPSHSPPPQPWEHGTLDHNGQCCSYWWFRTPRGRKEMYFDTGVSIKIPGEVARQESYCVEYFKKYVQSLKLSI
jgi:hypothetical protein